MKTTTAGVAAFYATGAAARSVLSVMKTKVIAFTIVAAAASLLLTSCGTTSTTTATTTTTDRTKSSMYAR